MSYSVIHGVDSNKDPVAIQVDSTGRLQLSPTSSFYAEAANYAAFPPAGDHTAEIQIAIASQGSRILFTFKDSGMYRSNGADWIRLGDTPTYFLDSEFRLRNLSDTTKTQAFDTSSITTATTRTITSADRDLSLSTPIFDTATLYTSYTETGSEAIGTTWWNQDENTLNVKLNNDVTGQMFEEMYFGVKNQTGVQIDDLTPVMFAGTLGASGRVLIQKAIADDSVPSSYTMGLATQDIANGGNGKVTWFGKVRGVTDGSQFGEVWNDGDLLYISPTTAGYLTKTKPNAPDRCIEVAAVISSHASSGTLIVRPHWNQKLVDLDDVNGTPTTVNGQILVWDNDNGYFDFTDNINNFARLDGTNMPFTGDISLSDNKLVDGIDISEYSYVSDVPTPTLWTKANDNTTITTPEIGPAGTISGTLDYEVAKFTNGAAAVNTSSQFSYDSATVTPDPNKVIIETWVKFDVSSADWISNTYREIPWANRAIPSPFHGIQFEIFFDAKLKILMAGEILGVDDPQTTRIETAAQSWAAGEFVHIMYVYDKDAGFDGAKTGALYWNRTEIGSHTEIIDVITPAPDFYFLSWSGALPAMHTYLDNIKIYSGAVSAKIIDNILQASETEGMDKNVLLQVGTNESIKLGDSGDATIAYDGTDLVINPKVVGSGCLTVESCMNIGDYMSIGYDNIGVANTDVHDVLMVNKDGVESILFRGNNLQNAIVVGNFNADGAYQKLNINVGAAGIEATIAIANGYQLNLAKRNRDFYFWKRDNKQYTGVAFTVVSSVATIDSIDHGFETGESMTASATDNAASLANANYTVTRIDGNTYTVPTAGIDGVGTITTDYNFALPNEQWLAYDSGADTLAIDTPTTFRDDLKFADAGSGLLYGNIYAYDQVVTTTFAGTTKTNKSQVTVFNVVGESNGCTSSAANDDITALTAGVYDIDVHCTIESTVAVASTIGMSIYVNNGATEKQACHYNRRLSGSNDTGSAGMHAPVALSANDTVEVWMWNDTNTNAILVSDISLTIKMIGA